MTLKQANSDPQGRGLLGPDQFLKPYKARPRPRLNPYIKEGHSHSPLAISFFAALLTTAYRRWRASFGHKSQGL